MPNENLLFRKISIFQVQKHTGSENSIITPSRYLNDDQIKKDIRVILGELETLGDGEKVQFKDRLIDIETRLKGWVIPSPSPFCSTQRSPYYPIQVRYQARRVEEGNWVIRDI